MINVSAANVCGALILINPELERTWHLAGILVATELCTRLTAPIFGGWMPESLLNITVILSI